MFLIARSSTAMYGPNSLTSSVVISCRIANSLRLSRHEALARENLAAYADVAKTAQLEGVELVISAGRDVQESAAATLRKATDEAAKTAGKRG